MGTRAERWLNRLFAVASVFLLLTILGESSAWATGDKGNTKLAIVVEGAPPSLRGGIGGELPSPWTQVDASLVGAAAKKRQLSRSLKALEDPATKGQYTSKLVMVAGDVGGRAAVVVVISTKRNDRKGHVILVADTGETLVDTQVALGAPADDAAMLAKAFRDKLDPLTRPDEPAAKPEPVAAVTATPVEGPKPDATPSAPRAPTTDAPPPPPPTQPEGAEPPPVLVGTLGVHVANRHLELRGVVTSAPVAYDSGFVLTPALAVDLFPGARSGSKVLEDFGVFGDVALGLHSEASWTRFDAGLKYRFWLKRAWSGAMIAPSVGYSQESYASDTPNDRRPPKSYKMVRPRVDVRVPVWRIAILGGAGFLAALDSGELADQFRDATVLGWEADLAATVPITRALEIRAGFGYRRMIYWFSPQRGDPNFARGANDQTFRPEIGVTAHL